MREHQKEKKILVKSILRNNFKKRNYFNFTKNLFIYFFQLSVTHDDIFGDYSCEATNKMGKLTRKVTLSEGAKAGIPMMQIAKVNRESTTFTILVREF